MGPLQEQEASLGLEMLEKEQLSEEWLEEYKDEGYIELVLKVLAQMCDGQFNGLQVCVEAT